MAVGVQVDGTVAAELIHLRTATPTNVSAFLMSQC